MNTNFWFLKNEWSGFFKNAREAEKNTFTAPRISAFYNRLTVESLVRWLYDHDSDLDLPYQHNLSVLMYESSFRNIIPPTMLRNLTYIRKLGNAAAHHKNSPSPEESYAAIRYLYGFTRWVVKMYSEKPPEIPLKLNEELIPKTGNGDKSLVEIQGLKKEIESKRQALERNRILIEKNELEIISLKTKLEKFRTIRENNRKVDFETDRFDYSEKITRELYIDILLREAGWNPKEKNVEEYEVYGMPNETGIGYADYVLWGDDGLPLAVVEAKKTQEDPHKGQHQAELYAGCLEKMHGQRPVIFYTNGFETWIWDDIFYPPRRVQDFYNKDELQWILNKRKSCKDLGYIEINRNIAERYYHEEALRRIAESFDSKSRRVLLVMATGSGKTRTAAATVDMLMKAGWIRRVLFLADRKALVTQAQNAFKEHLPHLTTVDLTKEKEEIHSRVVFSTYPTIMNRIDGEKTEDNRFYGSGHFDLVIIDEAHRSVYMKYKAIFDYFDALFLGLTATPKSEVDKNTYELFELEDHNPTYAYELEQAVADGYLVPPKGEPVHLGFMRGGIKYKDLTDEEKEQYELTFRDEETGYMPEEIGADAINAWLFNKDTVDKVLSHLMEDGLKVEGGDKIGKTIIFARNHDHAIYIEERFNKMYKTKIGKFLRVIDNYEPYAQDLLDHFSIKESLPQIAVSVDMLDTGIDIHEIVNLVFFKPVKSSAKYWQMIGRGTRLCEDLFGPGMDKKCFYIFDFCENFEFFDAYPDGIEALKQESISKKIFKNRLYLAEAIRESHVEDEKNLQLRNSLLDILQKEISGLNTENFIVRMHIKYVDKFKNRHRWENLSKSDVLDIINELSVLPEERKGDEYARRFDLLILNLQLAVVEKTIQQKRFQEQVMNIAKKIQKKSTIPSVQEQMTLLKAIVTSEFWENVTLPGLEEVREKIRNLVKFIDKNEQREVYTDFEDTLDTGEEGFDILKGYSKMENYRQRVERYIREHQDHLTIRKLKTNQSITTAELEELERILFDRKERGTKEDFQKIYGTDKPLGYFIRSILGLDVNAAKEAFSDFLSSGNLNADQIRFVDNIIYHLTRNGTIAKEMLFEPPFTDINDQGIAGVFEPSECNKILNIIDYINFNAVVA